MYLLEGGVSHASDSSNKIETEHQATREHDEKVQGEISNIFRITRWCGNDRDTPGTGGSKVNIHRSAPGDTHHLQTRRSIQHSIRYGRAMHEQNILPCKRLYQLLRVARVFSNRAFRWCSRHKRRIHIQLNEARV